MDLGLGLGLGLGLERLGHATLRHAQAHVGEGERLLGLGLGLGLGLELGLELGKG